MADQIQNNDNVLGISDDVSVSYDALATAQAITDSTPTITWNPNDTTAYVIGYYALEQTALAASGYVLSPEIDFDWVSGQVTWDEVSFSTTETQTITESFEEDFGMKNSIPKEHPKACCCCFGSAAVILPETE